MFDRIRKKGHREPAVRPEDLPEKVVFRKIDYDGEHMDLAVPIEATVSLDEEDDVFLLNEETSVYGIGPTLEDAMEDFCGSFLLCYKAQFKYGPGAIGNGILRYAGDNTIRKIDRPFPTPPVSQDVLLLRTSSSTIPRTAVNNGQPYPTSGIRFPYDVVTYPAYASEWWVEMQADEIAEIDEERTKRYVRMQAGLMFLDLDLQDAFGPYAQYYDPHSLELLDEKIEVMSKMKEGVPFEDIPNSKDILERLVKIGSDAGQCTRRGTMSEEEAVSDRNRMRWGEPSALDVERVVSELADKYGYGDVWLYGSYYEGIFRPGEHAFIMLDGSQRCPHVNGFMGECYQVLGINVFACFKKDSDPETENILAHSKLIHRAR